MSDFFSLVGNSRAALDLEPEDLAGLLVEFFYSLGPKEQERVMQTRHITHDMVPEPCEKRYDVQRAVIEAWHWLIREGILIPRPDGEADQYVFSRRGDMRTRTDVQAYQNRAKYPKELLHSTIRDKAWPLYLKGDYDTAVFQAFRQIEIAVRDVGGYTDGDHGKAMMRNAFAPSSEKSPGPLTDDNELPEEQKSLQELFAGAYARARNPTAHRHGVLNDPTEAFEMLVIASHLMRVVDRRRPLKAAP